MKVLYLIAFVTSVLEVFSLTTTVSSIETGVILHKRYKDKIINKEYKKLQDQKAALAESQTTKGPKPWLRTVSETKVEIVTPVVIAGVTFSTEPPLTKDGLEPWISLNKNGKPKTIMPKYKNAKYEKASPTYGTWFASVTTVTLGKDDIKAYNMKKGEKFEKVVVTPEDTTYQSLNPIIRCTPDYYFKKGLSKSISSEPFCFPHDNQVLYMDSTYFITWYSKFFKDASKVRVHLSLVQQATRRKGFKRSLNELEENNDKGLGLDKRSSEIEHGGRIKEASIFQSEWIYSDRGYFPITIDESWFGPKDYYKKALISIQPDNIDIEDFNHYANYVVVELGKRAKVGKEHLADLKKLEEKYRNRDLNIEFEEGPPYEKYMIIMGVPTCVMIIALGMYLFVWYNQRYIRLDHLKNVRFRGKKTTHKKIPFKAKSSYAKLPQYESDVQTKND